MADKPILFSAPMVRALLAGTKTQTRRALNPQPVSQGMKSYGEAWQWNWPGKGFAGVTADQMAKFGAASGMTRIAVGDRLYVREEWRAEEDFDGVKPRALFNDTPIAYEATPSVAHMAMGRLRRGIHMPRWASRITLTVTDVRVQRLQDISQSDAQDEGIQRLAVIGGNAWRDYSGGDGFNIHDPGSPAVRSYASLWNSINGAGSWDANPWVAAYTFTVERANIDELEAA